MMKCPSMLDVDAVVGRKYLVSTEYKKMAALMRALEKREGRGPACVEIFQTKGYPLKYMRLATSSKLDAQASLESQKSRARIIGFVAQQLNIGPVTTIFLPFSLRSPLRRLPSMLA